MKNGKFVISLDFELMWGVRDKMTIDNYGQNIKGVHAVIPRLLQMFDEKNIKATFSTVGFLFFKNINELKAQVPDNLPNYNDKNLSPYNGYIDALPANQNTNIYHFAPLLIENIKKYPSHEIGTHTFSHYYCLEPGQTSASFKADIESAIAIAKQNGIETTSLIFPRNQFNNEYLKVCADLGIICYRGNEQSYLYQAKQGNQENILRRMLRLVDTYLNISGNHCYTDEFLKQSYPVNIPSSRFLRPYSKTLGFIEYFRLKRIKKSMTFAAKNNQTYHLWWHPHNFGINQDQNFQFLNKILIHYQFLNRTYNFQSITMSNAAKQIINGN